MLTPLQSLSPPRKPPTIKSIQSPGEDENLRKELGILVSAITNPLSWIMQCVNALR